MRKFKSYVFGLLAPLIVAAMPQSAQATWLGLADGTYDVTLSCLFSSVISCPTDIHGTMTIGGSGASAFDFTVNGQHFVGDPANSVATNGVYTDQFSSLMLSPFSFLSLINDLTPNPFGLPTPHWWGYCNNFDATHCTPDTNGGWTADQIAAAPEPASLGLLALGFAAVLGWRRVRGSGASVSSPSYS
jgi:hypothetical protein